MKKLYLKKEVEFILTVILLVMIIVTSSYENVTIDLKKFSFVYIWFLDIILIYLVLRKYGRNKLISRYYKK